MYYQIANTAPLQLIESQLDSSLVYKKLYTKRKEINGLNETTIEVITSENPEKISLAIWGMIPEKFEDDWEDFQQITNTLTIRADHWKEHLWFSPAVLKRRCVIISTGFYTATIYEGKVHRYFVEHATEELLLFGGIYNQLDDGFLTSSILTKNANLGIKHIQNSVDTMPLIIDKASISTWLNQQLSTSEIDKLINEHRSPPLKVRPISSSVTYDFIGTKAL